MYYVTLSNISWNLFLWKTGKSKSSLVAQMVKNPPAMQEISPWVRKIPWRREGLPIPVFLPGKSHGREPGGLQSMGSQSQTQLLPVFISWGCHEKWPQTECLKTTQGLSWLSSGKESTCQCRGRGFDPWSRKIPHAVGQLSLCAITTEACVP